MSTCKECVYWKKEESTMVAPSPENPAGWTVPGTGPGECRIGSPTGSGFPITKDSDWCGKIILRR